MKEERKLVITFDADTELEDKFRRRFDRVYSKIERYNSESLKRDEVLTKKTVQKYEVERLKERVTSLEETTAYLINEIANLKKTVQQQGGEEKMSISNLIGSLRCSAWVEIRLMDDNFILKALSRLLQSESKPSILCGTAEELYIQYKSILNCINIEDCVIHIELINARLTLVIEEVK